MSVQAYPLIGKFALGIMKSIDFTQSRKSTN